MKIFLRVPKIFGFLILGFIFLFGLALVRAINYPKYELKAMKKYFTGIETQAEIEAWIDSLVEEMTLNEKLPQMYGERPFRGWQKFKANSFQLPDLDGRYDS
jgi:hypothetical protein